MRRRRVGVLLAALLGALVLAAVAGAAEPSHDKQQAKGPQIFAKSWALIDGRTGEVLTSHAGAARLPSAAAAKLMSDYLALRVARAGEVPSKESVAEMNRYAAALGLTNTHFAHPAGGDQKGNYSSALDLATLTEELEKIPAFAKIADSREAELSGVRVGAARKNGIRLISVAIDAPTDETRFSDNLELLEWGFRQFHRSKVLKKGEELAGPSIKYSGGELPLRVSHSLKVGLRDGQEPTVEVDAPGQVTGPIRRGARLGTATVSVDGLRAGSVALVAGRAVPAASSFDKARGFIGENPVTLAIAACAILIAAALSGRYLRRIRRGKRGQHK